MSAQKVLQDLSLEQIKALKEMNPILLQDEVKYLQHKLSDMLFNNIGVELDDLIQSTDLLKMEEDKEYAKMMDEYNEKIELLHNSKE
jgi:hypothetical protein